MWLLVKGDAASSGSSGGSGFQCRERQETRGSIHACACTRTIERQRLEAAATAAAGRENNFFFSELLSPPLCSLTVTSNNTMDMTRFLFILSLLVLSVSGGIYEDCSAEKSVVCVGSKDNVNSAKGKGVGEAKGCLADGDCQVIMLIQESGDKAYNIKLAADNSDKANLIRVAIMTENLKLYKNHEQAFPNNMLFLEGSSVTKDQTDARVMIKYSTLPLVSCVKSADGCEYSDEPNYHYEPAGTTSEGDMSIFSFNAKSKNIRLTAGSSRDYDGENNDGDYNVHLKTDQVVIGLYHIVSDWEGEGEKYPSHSESSSTLINLIETYPFKLFKDEPRFLPAHRKKAIPLTWLWILIAFCLVILFLLLIFWILRKRRENKAEADGHVALSSIRSNQPSARSGVHSNMVSNKFSGVGQDQRSDMPSKHGSSNQVSSSHEPHKTHLHPSDYIKDTTFAPTSGAPPSPVTSGGLSTAAGSLGPTGSTPASSSSKNASTPASAHAGSAGGLSSSGSNKVGTSKPNSKAKSSSSGKASNPDLNQGLSSF